MKLYQLRYCAAMTQICIFPYCSQYIGDYDVIEPVNSTLRDAPSWPYS